MWGVVGGGRSEVERCVEREEEESKGGTKLGRRVRETEGMRDVATY
jgi:hypothetical protein